MSFKGKEFLLFSRSLANEVENSKNELNGMKPAAIRTILSRAYYSAFLEARNFLSLNNDSSGSVHGKVQDRISKLDKTTGNRIKELKHNRTQADYVNNSDRITMKHVKNSLRMANKVIESLKILKI